MTPPSWALPNFSLMWSYGLMALSYSTDPIFSSFSVEFLTLLHGLEWCHSHFNTFHFQSALFLTDSLSAIALLSTVPAFLQPKSLRDIWTLFDSSHVALKLPVGPRYYELADILAKTRAIFLRRCTHPLAPVFAKIRHTRYARVLSRAGLYGPGSVWTFESFGPKMQSKPSSFFHF